MSTTSDIIRKAMGEEVAQYMSGEQLATQSALAETEVKRLGKEMELNVEQFQAREERGAATDVMQAMVSMLGIKTQERVAGMRAMGVGGTDTLGWLKFLTETPEVLQSLKEGKDIKSKIYTPLTQPESNTLFATQVGHTLNRLTNDPINEQTAMQHEILLRNLSTIPTSENGEITLDIIERRWSNVRRWAEWTSAPKSGISTFIEIAAQTENGREKLNQIYDVENLRVREEVGKLRHDVWFKDKNIRLDKSKGHDMRHTEVFLREFAKEAARIGGYDQGIENLDDWARNVASIWIGAESNKNTPIIQQFESMLQTMGISIRDVPIITPAQRNILPLVDSYRSTMYNMKEKVSTKDQGKLMALAMLASQSDPKTAEFIGNIISEQRKRAEELAGYNPFYHALEKGETLDETHLTLTRNIFDELGKYMNTVQWRVDYAPNNITDLQLLRKVADELGWVGTYQSHQDLDKAQSKAEDLLDWLDGLDRIEGEKEYAEGKVGDWEVRNIYYLLTDPKTYGLKFDESVERDWEFLPK